MILIKVSPPSAAPAKSYALELNSLSSHMPRSLLFVALIPTKYNKQQTSKETQERNEQTAVMKCIIIFSLSSGKLFFITEAESIWRMLLYTTHISQRERENKEENCKNEQANESNEKAYFHFSCALHFHNLILLLLQLLSCVFILVGFSVWWGSKWRILNSKLSLKLKKGWNINTYQHI